MEIDWLHRHGLVASYDDYVELPVDVLADARMLIEYELAATKAASTKRAQNA